MHGEQLITMHWAYDNQNGTGFGSSADLDARPHQISIELPTFLLRAGTYTLSSLSQNQQLIIPPPKDIEIYPVPNTAQGLLSFSRQNISYAPNENGFAFFTPIQNDGIIPLEGMDSYIPVSNSPKGSLPIQKEYTPRILPLQYNWVSFCLLPLSIGLIIGLGVLFRRFSMRSWFIPILIGGLIIHSVFPLSPQRLLVSEIGFEDPPTSASFLYAISSNITSPISQSYSFPEGHNWLIMGPSWLAYLLLSPCVWLLDGIQAHNIGVGFFCCLLYWSIYQYAKTLPLSKEACVFAALGGVLAPGFIQELDKLSLDRTFLFPIPLLFWTFSQKGKTAIWGSALSLSLLFYGQFYYGIFLGAALPFLLMYRWKKEYFLGAFCALILFLPGIFLLKTSTTGTVYEGASFSFLDMWNPVSQQQLAAFTQQFDPRLGAGIGDKPMNSAQEQLMTSIVNSIQAKDVLFPSVYFCGQSLFWFWIGIALLISRHTKHVVHTSLDILILSLFAMGPFLRSSTQELLSPLPFYAYQLLIPSFTQLKHPDRFIFMAAVIAAIPIAFAFDRLLKPIQNKFVRWCGMIVFLICTLQVGIIKEDAQSMGDISVHIEDQEYRIGLKKLYLPQSTELTTSIAYEFPAKSSVALFPQLHPIHREHYLPFLAQHIPMQNPPPHGEFSDNTLSLWPEKNRILNALAYLSASQKINTFFGRSAGELDLKELTEQGLTHIVIHIPDLIDTRQRTFIADFMARFSTQVHSDEIFDIYALRIP